MAPAARGPAAVSGLLAGLLANAALAVTVPALPWLWWNPIGWTVTVAAGLLLARTTPRLPRGAASRREITLLLAGFATMLLVLAAL
jgi:hypothetical protein